MNINVINAANFFFSRSSLESVYFEAVANSLDANSSKIWLEIKIDEFTDVSSFELSISDNGDGFTDKNFHKFENLLEVEENTHKGVGRLVFLQYFNKVEVTSSYSNITRNFIFNKDFSGKYKTTDGKKTKKTTLRFLNYSKSRINEYRYLIPSSIKESLLQHFFLRFYKYKTDNTPLEIFISLDTSKPNADNNFLSGKVKLDVKDIPELLEENCDAQNIDFFSKFRLLYSIKQTFVSKSLITAICADGRTIAEDIISKNSLPYGYEMIFLLDSDYFTGKTNASRDILELDDDSLKKIKQLFSNKVSAIINREVQSVRENNAKLDDDLNEKYPHLVGYFEKDTIGLISRDTTIENAQKKFLKDQKTVLEAIELEDNKLEKYFEVSSRLLTNYILYRNLIIQKLKNMDKDNDEEDIHNLIVPKRKTYNTDNFINTIFSNNAWLLDDKYMSYTTVLSDEKVKEIFKNLDVKDSSKKKNKRPDITIIFSNNPDNVKKTDVIIIELKKLKLELEKREVIISQLRDRARTLLNHFPDKIQRIWFYGIVDIDKEFRRSLLEDKYIELYSTGSLFYREYETIIDEENNNKIIWGLFIQSYESFVNDAETRNSTFLKILRESIKENITKHKNIEIEALENNTSLLNKDNTND